MREPKAVINILGFQNYNGGIMEKKNNKQTGIPRYLPIIPQF